MVQNVKHETQLNPLHKPETFGLSVSVSSQKTLLISLAALQLSSITLSTCRNLPLVTKTKFTWSEISLFPGVDRSGHKKALFFIPMFRYGLLLFDLLFTGITVLFNYPSMSSELLQVPSCSFHLQSCYSTDEGKGKRSVC